jgi:hypothetical protein
MTWYLSSVLGIHRLGESCVSAGRFEGWARAVQVLGDLRAGQFEVLHGLEILNIPFCSLCRL